MNTNTTQTTFAAMQDWNQPQTVAASQLVTVIAQVNTAGFRAVGLAVLPSAYRVTFQRMAVISEARGTRPAGFDGRKRNLFLSERTARTLNSPFSLYKTPKQVVSFSRA
jgi:hypothetical protein